MLPFQPPRGLPLGPNSRIIPPGGGPQDAMPAPGPIPIELLAALLRGQMQPQPGGLPPAGMPPAGMPPLPMTPPGPMGGPPMGGPPMGGPPTGEPLPPATGPQPPLPPEMADLLDAQQPNTMPRDPVADQLSAVPDIGGQGAENPLLEAMPELRRLLRPPGPKLPRNFRKPPKPNVADIQEFATSQEDAYEPLRDRFSHDLELYLLKRVGTFKTFDPDEDESFVSTALADEINLIANLGAGIEISYIVPYTDPARESDTQKAEDFLHYAREEAELRHAMGGNGDLRRDEWFSLALYGRVVSRTTLNTDDDRFPFRHTLLDPATCFPSFEKGQLSRMVRVYGDTVNNVASEFEFDSNLYDKLTKGTKNRQKRKGEDVVKVIEYWDRWWKALIVDDEPVIPPTAHEYGFVPFVYQISANGLPAFMRPPDSEPETADKSAISEELVNKGVSNLHFQQHSHVRYEAMMSVLMNILDKVDHPAMFLEQDEAAQRTAGLRTFSNERDTVNPVVAGHEKPSPYITQPMPQIVQPLMQAIMINRQTGMMPEVAYGASLNGQVSGNAIEGLNEAGRDKLTPYLRSMELYHAQVARQYLVLWRDWGSLAIPDEYNLPTGVLRVPYRFRRPTPNRPPAFDLDPETIDRAGTNAKVKMTAIRMQNLAALGNVVQMWNSLGAMSLREGMELRGVHNPEDVFEEVAYERAILDERMQDLKKLDELRRRNHPMANIFAAKILSSEQQSVSGGPPGGGESPFAGMPPGTNFAALGGGPGTQGGPVGRPPNAGGGGPLPF